MDQWTEFQKFTNEFSNIVIRDDTSVEALVNETLHAMNQIDITSEYFRELLVYLQEQCEKEFPFTGAMALMQLTSFRYYAKLALLSKDSNHDELYKLLYLIEKFEDRVTKLMYDARNK